MRAIIRDTGLENLIGVLYSQISALPGRDSAGWPRSYNGMPQQNTSKKPAVTPGSPQNGPVAEKDLVLQPSNDTYDALERGPAEGLVDWYGPDDPEVLSLNLICDKA